MLVGLFRDKAEIRSLYKQHKNLERELERFTDQVSPESPDGAAAATSSSAPSAPENPSDKPDADMPALLSPTPSIGAGEEATSQGGNAETPTVPTKGADSESQSDEKKMEETEKDRAEDEDGTAASAIPVPSDLDDQLPTSIPPSSTGQDGDLQESGGAGGGESKKDGDLQESGNAGEGEAKKDGDLQGSGDAGEGEAKKDGDLEGSGNGGEGKAKEDGALERSGDGGEGKAEEEEIDGGGASETQGAAVSGEDENGADTPEGEAAKTDQPQQEEPSGEERLDEIPGDSVVTSPTPLLSPVGDTANLGVGGEEGDSEVPMGSATAEEGDAPGRDDNGDKGGLEPCVEGETHESWPGRASEDALGLPASLAEGDRVNDDGDDDKPMTAQEARVKRMRARFLRMKNLIDDDAVGPSSLAASNTLLSGLDASLEMEENEYGITSPPGEPHVPVCVLVYQTVVNRGRSTLSSTHRPE